MVAVPQLEFERRMGQAKVIDRVRQGSIVGSVGPLHSQAGPATVARKCGPAGPSRGRGPAWTDKEPSWAVPPEDVPEDPADEPDVLY
jgi:hypothetical protein